MYGRSRPQFLSGDQSTLALSVSANSQSVPVMRSDLQRLLPAILLASLCHSALAAYPDAESSSFGLDTSIPRLDSDSDGMVDSWEELNGLNISSSAAALDPDGDGRSNLNEYDAGTNPRTNDWLGPYVVESATLLLDTGGYPFDLSADSALRHIDTAMRPPDTDG